MIKRMKEACLGIIPILCVTVTSGCVPLLIGAAAGAGGIVYVRGALVQNVDETVEDIHAATLAAAKDLGLFVVSDELNRHAAAVKAEYKDGKKVDIRVDAITEFVSKITIRVGLIGDSDESGFILSAIEEKIK